MAIKNSQVLEHDDEDDEIEGAEQQEQRQEKPDPKSAAEAGDDVEFIEVEDEPEGDRRLAAEEQQETDDERRERRRREKKERKERQTRARNERDRELEELRAQNAELAKAVGTVHQRLTQQDLHAIDGKIAAEKAQANEAAVIMQQAAAKGQWDVFTKAQDIRDDATFKARQLEAYKANAVQTVREQQTQAPRASQETVRRAKAWSEKHKDWFDPDGKDEDSEMARAIDNSVKAAGFNPDTDAYWQELDRRLARALPEHFEDEDDEEAERRPARRPSTRPGARKGPAVGGRGTGGAPGKTVVRVTPERKQAMIEAGAWDDPVKRKSLLKRYAEMDKQNATAH